MSAKRGAIKSRAARLLRLEVPKIFSVHNIIDKTDLIKTSVPEGEPPVWRDGMMFETDQEVPSDEIWCYDIDGTLVAKLQLKLVVAK